jgi:hypothetical protein
MRFSGGGTNVRAESKTVKWVPCGNGLTTNLKDHAPLANALGKQAILP